MGSLPSKKSYTTITASISNLQANHLATAAYVPGPVEDKCVFVALYNFPLGGQPGFTVRVGEQLHLLSEDGDWWKVASISTGKECYMPKKNIAKVYNSWLYSGINREKAEELLMLNGNRVGSFLIRESETRKGSFSLSIRRANQASRDGIKHYRINSLENGWFYISPRLTFPTLQEMVDYYWESADGICCVLKEPCVILGMNNSVIHGDYEPVMVRNPTLNWKELDSSALFKEDNGIGEDCPVSLGLREAVSSYMFMTEDFNSKSAAEREHLWRTF
ncbi:src-like-adapter 2 [Pelobates cultripes]|uniref:Src-like-adapter 2 n=1 Tax=Pelobates cultripes TaxID=61616 RepID=A0AAD1S6T2_PELCU|nr:src-like-adapter 2 [Pelobates cultripes]